MVKMGFKTWDVLHSGEDKINMLVLEIASKDRVFGFRWKSLNKMNDLIKGKDLNLHAQTKRVFSERNKVLEREWER